MSASDYLPQAPLSINLPRLATATGPYCPRRPTLREILANTSSAPWTLTAFMAYLSNNHCLETLEFTLDAARYRKHYAKMMSKITETGLPPLKDREYIQGLWKRLIEAYIMSNGSREVNLPAEVRDPLVYMPIGTLPPAPEKLDTAVAKIYELMEESVLVPFLNSFYPQSAYTSHHDYHSFDQHSVNDDAVSVATSVSRDSRPRLNRRNRSVRSTPASESASTGTLSSPPPPFSHPLYFRKSAPAPLSESADSYGQQYSIPAVPNLPHASPSPTTAMSHSGSGRSSRTAVHQYPHPPPPPHSLPGMMMDDTGSAESPSYDSPSTPPTPPLAMTASEPKRDLSQLRHTTSAPSPQGMWQRLGKLGRMRTGKKMHLPPSSGGIAPVTSAPAAMGEK